MTHVGCIRELVSNSMVVVLTGVPRSTEATDARRGGGRGRRWRRGALRGRAPARLARRPQASAAPGRPRTAGQCTYSYALQLVSAESYRKNMDFQLNQT